jgi:hypothetical protein
MVAKGTSRTNEDAKEILVLCFNAVMSASAQPLTRAGLDACIETISTNMAKLKVKFYGIFFLS